MRPARWVATGRQAKEAILNLTATQCNHSHRARQALLKIVRDSHAVAPAAILEALAPIAEVPK